MKKSSIEKLEFQNEIFEDSPPEYTLEASRVLHIYFDSMMQRHARILDSDKQTVLYTVDLQCMKGRMKFHSNNLYNKISSSNNSDEIGSVNFHFLTSRIDTTIHSNPTPLKSLGFTKQAYSFTSPHSNKLLTWKARNACGNPLKMDLVTPDGIVIARFEPTAWAAKKAGKLHLLDSAAETGPLMDEIVITGFAVAHYRSQQLMATPAGAAVAVS